MRRARRRGRSSRWHCILSASSSVTCKCSTCRRSENGECFRGTSPLYVLETIFHHQKSPPTEFQCIGAVSLIIWSLILVVSIKYAMFILRADNRGEGGTFALCALLTNSPSPLSKNMKIFVNVSSILAASLLIGNSFFSFLLLARRLHSFLLPYRWWSIDPRRQCSFCCGRFGVECAESASVGRSHHCGDHHHSVRRATMGNSEDRWEAKARSDDERGRRALRREYLWTGDGPLVCVVVLHRCLENSIETKYSQSFQSLSSRDLSHSREETSFLSYRYVHRRRHTSVQNISSLHWISAGGVFLSVTGCEALYADLGKSLLFFVFAWGRCIEGHFGLWPVRISWFAVVLPCVISNYLGQGALLIHHPQAVESPYERVSLSFLALPSRSVRLDSTVLFLIGRIGQWSFSRRLPRVKIFSEWSCLIWSVVNVSHRFSSDHHGLFFAVESSRFIGILYSLECLSHQWEGDRTNLCSRKGNNRGRAMTEKRCAHLDDQLDVDVLNVICDDLFPKFISSDECVWIDGVQCECDHHDSLSDVNALDLEEVVGVCVDLCSVSAHRLFVLVCKCNETARRRLDCHLYRLDLLCHWLLLVLRRTTIERLSSSAIEWDNIEWTSSTIRIDLPTSTLDLSLPSTIVRSSKWRSSLLSFSLHCSSSPFRSDVRRRPWRRAFIAECAEASISSAEQCSSVDDLRASGFVVCRWDQCVECDTGRGMFPHSLLSSNSAGVRKLHSSPSQCSSADHLRSHSIRSHPVRLAWETSSDQTLRRHLSHHGHVWLCRGQRSLCSRWYSSSCQRTLSNCNSFVRESDYVFHSESNDSDFDGRTSFVVHSLATVSLFDWKTVSSQTIDQHSNESEEYHSNWNSCSTLIRFSSPIK